MPVLNDVPATAVDPRYDEIMRGLYAAASPAWLTPASRPLFLRESRRRRCELASILRRRWPCASYYARSAVSEEFAALVCEAFAADAGAAPSLVAGVHAAVLCVLARAGAGAPAAALDLVRYESLFEADIPLPPGIRRGRFLLVRLDHDVPAAYPHLSRCRAALAPPSLVREQAIEPTAVLVAVSDRPGGGRAVVPVAGDAEVVHEP